MRPSYSSLGMMILSGHWSLWLAFSRISASFGTGLAGAVLMIMGCLVDARYLLMNLELLRQYAYVAAQVTDCGRMLGG